MPPESRSLNAISNASAMGSKPKASKAGTIKFAPDIRGLPLARKWPLIEEGMRLTDEVLALPWQERPMVWSDLPLFEARHGRNAHDMIYDLGMHQANHYRSRVGLHEVLPFDIELLVRLYDRYPSSCLWTCPTLQDMFFRIYGQAIEGFPPALQDRARNAFGMRFARLMGRAPTVQYRWLWDSAMQDKSGSTRRVRNIISKLYEASLAGLNPRKVLEDVSGYMWVLRGLNVDAETPVHDPISLQKRAQKKSAVDDGPEVDRACQHHGARNREKGGEDFGFGLVNRVSGVPAPSKTASPAYEGGAFALGDD